MSSAEVITIIVSVVASIVLPLIVNKINEANKDGTATATIKAQGTALTELQNKVNTLAVELNKAANDFALCDDVTKLRDKVQAMEVNAAAHSRDVANLIGTVHSLRSDMDKRFDHLERLITGSGIHKAR